MVAYAGWFGWDESRHPREHGRWVDLYHGTDADYADDIVKHGLSTPMGYTPENLTVQSDEDDARGFAEETADAPAVVHIRIPDDKLTEYLQPPEGWENGVAHGLRKPIPAEYVVGVEKK